MAQELIPDQAQGILSDLLSFRHFYRNAYGIEFRDDEVTKKAQTLTVAWPIIESALTGAIEMRNSQPPRIAPVVETSEPSTTPEGPND